MMTEPLPTTPPNPTNAQIGEYVFSQLVEPEFDSGGVPVRYSLVVGYQSGVAIQYDFERPPGALGPLLVSITYSPAEGGERREG